MRVLRWKWITRQDLRRNRDKIFLFGDNAERWGNGGQAKEMRGEPNAIGVPTKISPTRFFIPQDYYYAKHLIDEAFSQIPKHSTVVIPEDGIGTGLAQLDTKAPSVLQYINMKIRELEESE